MIDTRIGVLAVRRVGQLTEGTLVWDRTTRAWAIIATMRRCDDASPAHPDRDQECAALTLRPLAEAFSTEPADETHFALDAALVALLAKDIEEVASDAAR